MFFVELLLLPSVLCFFFLMIRRPPRSTLDRSSAASDVYKRQVLGFTVNFQGGGGRYIPEVYDTYLNSGFTPEGEILSLIHISEPTRPY